MRYLLRSIIPITLICLATLSPALANTSSSQASNGPNIPAPKFSVTHHSMRIAGQTIHFTATAGSLILHNSKGQPTASVFFIAYTKDNVQNESNRPLTFLYNGGPGSSAVWLQLGAFGPMRVKTTNAAITPPAPYHLVNNAYSLINVSDMVFIDPVGTGFSHVVGKGKGKDFWGVDQDAQSLVQFIRLYLNKYHRWNSPKFILGESYGTTRSAVLANDLQNNGISLNGVILQSAILNFETDSYAPGNDLPYMLSLPSYAAVAWYHHALPNQPKKLQPLLGKVEHFAMGEYAQALRAGTALSQTQREDVLTKLHQYTGIPESYWANANLRINNGQFEKELLRNRNEVTGRLDARFSGMSIDWNAEYPRWDPMMEAIAPVFVAAFHHYLADYLRYHSDRKYQFLNYRVIQNWDWKQKTRGEHGGQAWPGYTNVVPDLSMAMVKNPHLQLMVNSGYFDLGTPFFATKYSMHHLLDPDHGGKQLLNRVHMYYYKSGHMVYLHVPSLAKYKSNLAKFIKQTLSSQHD